MVICYRLEIYKTFTAYEQIMEYVWVENARNVRNISSCLRCWCLFSFWNIVAAMFLPLRLLVMELSEWTVTKVIYVTRKLLWILVVFASVSLKNVQRQISFQSFLNFASPTTDVLMTNSCTISKGDCWGKRSYQRNTITTQVLKMSVKSDLFFQMTWGRIWFHR